MKKNSKQMPDGSWGITKEDKAQVLELGRLLNKVILDYGKEKGELHIKVVTGACQYVIDLHSEIQHALADDVVAAQGFLEQSGFGVKINEPFYDEPVVEKALAPAKEIKPEPVDVAVEESAV